MPESDSTPFATTLSITMTATNNSLARVIAVLHQRGAHVQHLTWAAPGLRSRGHARMTLVAQFHHDRTQNLRTSLARLVDVLDVQDAGTASAECWSKPDSTWW